MAAPGWPVVLPIVILILSVVFRVATGYLHSFDAIRALELAPAWLMLWSGAFSLEPEWQDGRKSEPPTDPRRLRRVLRRKWGNAFAIALGVPAILFGGAALNGVPVDAVALIAGLPEAVLFSGLGILGRLAFGSAAIPLAIGIGLWLPNAVFVPLRNPIFPLGSYSVAAAHVGMQDLWLLDKALVLGVAALLFGRISRRLDRATRPVAAAPPRAGALVALGVGVAVASVYTLSATIAIVALSAAQVRKLGPEGPNRLRLQFQVFGDLPISRLFGEPFHVLMHPSVAGSRWSDRLSAALKQHPHDPWAEWLAYELALDELRGRPPTVAGCMEFARERPGSPLTPAVLLAGVEARHQQMTSLSSGAVSDSTMPAAEFVVRFPRHDRFESVARYLDDRHWPMDLFVPGIRQEDVQAPAGVAEVLASSARKLPAVARARRLLTAARAAGSRREWATALSFAGQARQGTSTLLASTSSPTNPRGTALTGPASQELRAVWTEAGTIVYQIGVWKRLAAAPSALAKEPHAPLAGALRPGDRPGPRRPGGANRTRGSLPPPPLPNAPAAR